MQICPSLSLELKVTLEIYFAVRKMLYLRILSMLINLMLNVTISKKYATTYQIHRYLNVRNVRTYKYLVRGNVRTSSLSEPESMSESETERMSMSIHL